VAVPIRTSIGTYTSSIPCSQTDTPNLSSAHDAGTVLLAHHTHQQAPKRTYIHSATFPSRRRCTRAALPPPPTRECFMLQGRIVTRETQKEESDASRWHLGASRWHLEFSMESREQDDRSAAFSSRTHSQIRSAYALLTLCWRYVARKHSHSSLLAISNQLSIRHPARRRTGCPPRQTPRRR